MASACETAKRLAPPGFFKYEEIAGDAPPNLEIEARKAARAAEGDGAFPVISDAPRDKPQPPPQAEQDAMARDLIAARDKLAEDVAADRAAAAADADAAALEAKRGALEKAVQQQRRAAAAERDDRPK